MSDKESFGSFLSDNKRLVKDWLDVQLSLWKLKLLRIFSRSAGHLLWIILSLFMIFIFLIFLGITTGFWLSSITGSYTSGFGLATLGILLLVLVLAAFRKSLFVDPIIRSIIGKAMEKKKP